MYSYISVAIDYIMFKKISIIVPVYNEEKTLRQILEKLKATDFSPLEKEIIIVNDASSDGTAAILAELVKTENYKIITHEKNAGKGAAIRTGFKSATGDLVTIQDADLEYDPAELAKLTKPILDGQADVVYGSRMLGSHKTNNFYYYLGNKFLSLATNILYNTSLTDMETCYKVIKTDIVKNINIVSNRFDFEPEITAKILRGGHRIFEMPISYCGRNFKEGKKITWRDGIKALWVLVKYRLPFVK